MHWPKITTLITLLLSPLLLVIPAGLATEPLLPATVFAQANGACPALPPPTGNVVHVSTVAALKNAVNSATSGTTILIADGTYHFGGGDYLRFEVPELTLRSASGNRNAVVIDGDYQALELVQIVASNVTIADLTLREAYYHPIHVMSSDAGHTLNTLIHNVNIVDPGEQAIKINPSAEGYYPDDGVIACSHIELTDAGRPHIRNNCYTGGVDAHQARGWTIRDNLIEGFWCENGLSEHGVHMWRGCRDTLVERNLLRNNARGIGFGLVTEGDARTYPDNPCPGAVTGRLDAAVDQVLVHRLVATQEDMVGRPHPAHGQVILERPYQRVGQAHRAVLHALALAHREPAPGQVFQAQLLDLAQPQTGLPEQVKGGPVEQASRCGL